MRLFIAEKPSLAQAIANNLGSTKKEKGYITIIGTSDIVTWCYGHILSAAPPEAYNEAYSSWSFDTLPIVPIDWKLVVTPSCKEQFNIIKGLIKKADVIVHAGDPDREGQLLVDEVLEYVGTKNIPIKRILLNALDDISVKKALSTLQDNKKFQCLKNSARARSQADWLIGMNLTRAYTLKMREASGSGVYSIGRVQTPTMSLVIRREEEIKNFQPTDYYVLNAVFATQSNEEIKAIWYPSDTQPGLDSENRLIDQNEAIKVLEKIKNQAGTVSSCTKTEKSEKQPLPYSLSALQIDAGKRYGLTPQQVLTGAQCLYEKKYTTYPRSDCDYLPESQHSEAPKIISNIIKTFPELSVITEIASPSIKAQSWNDKKITAHHAIIPTTNLASLAGFSETEKTLYKMIVQRYIAQFLPVHKYLATKIEIICQDEKFVATGKTVTETGWKQIYSTEKNISEDPEEDHQELPKVTQNDKVYQKDGEVISRTTKPPSRFTESTLLKAMKEIYKYCKQDSLKATFKECSGIGTEATRASIIENLKQKEYIIEEKKKLYPSPKALDLYKILPESLRYPDTTAVWEDNLNKISTGNQSLQEFMQKQNKVVENFVKQAISATVSVQHQTQTEQCPVCKKGNIRLINGKFGKFWKCSNKECNETFPDSGNKPLVQKCPQCKTGFLRKIKGSKGQFWSCNKYPECKAAYPDKKNRPVFKK